MGNKLDKEIQKKSAEMDKEMRSTIKLLLLGTGGSGKSTVFKQIQRMHGQDLTGNEHETLTQVVKQNILDDTSDVCREYPKIVSQKPEYEIKDQETYDLVEKYAVAFSSHSEEFTLNPDTAKDIAKLWQNDQFKKVFYYRAKQMVMDNTPWFYEKVEQIADENYKIDFEDYIRARHKTTGVINAQFQYKYQNKLQKIQITDVGGQRAERKKWIYVFENTTAVIFVISLSDYNQYTYEDNQTRCLDESMKVWDEVCSYKTFENVDFIVFLNKQDLLLKKLEEVSFKEHVPDYPGEDDFQQIINYYEEKVKVIFDKHTPKNTRTLSFHKTQATDENQMKQIITKIQFQTVQRHLNNLF